MAQKCCLSECKVCSFTIGTDASTAIQFAKPQENHPLVLRSIWIIQSVYRGVSFEINVVINTREISANFSSFRVCLYLIVRTLSLLNELLLRIWWDRKEFSRKNRMIHISWRAKDAELLVLTMSFIGMHDELWLLWYLQMLSLQFYLIESSRE